MKAQLTQYQLDNLTVLDVLMNTLSAAEKLVFGPNEGKKYAYYDEGNSSEWKNTYQLLKELQIQKECLQSIIRLYQRNSNKKDFIFPINLSKQEIIKDLLILRDEAYKKFKDYKIKTIYEDIIRIINLDECCRYTVEQIYANNTIEDYPMDEDHVKNQAKAMMEAKEKIIKRDKENEENLINNNGIIKYEAKIFLPKKSYRRNNDKEQDYFKNLYNNAYNDYK